MTLTVKQRRALRACADPTSDAGLAFWHAARMRWPGPRRTLGSLHHRGLVTYDHAAGWAITDQGRAALEAQTPTKGES